MLFEACSDGTEVPQLIEETFDEVAEPVEEWAEHWNVHAACLRLDVGPAAPPGRFLAQSIAVVGAVRQQDLAFAYHTQHTGSPGAVMGLTFCELQQDIVQACRPFWRMSSNAKRNTGRLQLAAVSEPRTN